MALGLRKQKQGFAISKICKLKWKVMWGWKIKPLSRGISQLVLGYRAWKRGLWMGTLTSEKELQLPSAGYLWEGMIKLMLKSVEQSSNCIYLPLWERKCYWQKRRDIAGLSFTATTSSQKANRKLKLLLFLQLLLLVCL